MTGGTSDSSIAELMRSTQIISEMMTPTDIEIVLRRLELTLRDGIPGDVVELGCNCGTTSVFIAKLLERRGESRAYHVYDSFAGLPPSGPEDLGPESPDLPAGTFMVARADFARNLRDAGVAGLPQIHERPFDRLDPGDLPNAISFAFLDGDLYESILTSLELVYPRLPQGGAIVVDDYGLGALPGVERACTAFLADKSESASAVDGATLAVIVKDEGSGDLSG